MTELSAKGWLWFAGAVGAVTPWVVNWSYQNLGFPEFFPMIYVTAVWGAVIASSISLGGGIRLLCGFRSELDGLVAILLGLFGLGSSFLALIVSMM